MLINPERLIADGRTVPARKGRVGTLLNYNRPPVSYHVFMISIDAI